MKENLKFASFLIVFFLIGGVIVVLSIFEFFVVSGDSMLPTYSDGQYLFVYSKEDQVFNREDVIIYKDGEILSVKRVIAVPGEEVQIDDSSVYIDGIKLGEPYLTPGARTCVPIDCTSNDAKLFKVPDGEYFVLGDNREVSRDSRDCYEDIQCSDSGFRSIPREEIVGKIATTLPSWLSSLLISEEE